MPLDDLKRAAKALGVSLNDVFVGSVLGGMHRYHEEHDVDAPQLRMIMPISVRGDGGGLGGNHFTPARVMVPTHAQNPVHRIEEVSERCRRLRAEPAVAMTEQIDLACQAIGVVVHDHVVIGKGAEASFKSLGLL